MIGFRRFALALAGMTLSVGAHAGVLTMGTGGTYATLADAVAAAQAGDTILIEPGTYTNQVATINIPLTIEGAGSAGQVVFNQTAAELPGLKGYLVTNADTTVENITFENAAVSEGDGDNGAGIRYQAGNLTVINSRFNKQPGGHPGDPGHDGHRLDRDHELQLQRQRCSEWSALRLRARYLHRHGRVVDGDR